MYFARFGEQMLTSDEMELIGERALGFKNSITPISREQGKRKSLNKPTHSNEEIAAFMEVAIRACKKHLCQNSPIRSAVILELQKNRQGLMNTFNGIKEGTLSPRKLDSLLQGYTESICAKLLPETLLPASNLRKAVSTILFEVARESV
ncbi:hypothetical protein [Pseudoalteromonas luteoviolacea]|uniref:Uncharacterized protein n=2 Tax=Pseudoalteromonas luteoviolacea TaxID=43657 RepID=A0A0F6A5A5_9GAMM|nr:hypothetical protein [Pseudoalteromonas luteoviolacea]AOT07630.1 hypothetical protein S4054249_07145 [Pseudoalteromonas luteoviolacea]AOT12546.1 hypothetical protein S40542_07145 [Pseudoalteromonas luteoviolacea]AOT17460.1 hypothetical protein S4054_07145 [Pseudoalteromonas luteoviolacea]KKE81372.1 hypothetical protein N479_22830 [Pseudoalteromonas luteoviolacea S4054]KZN70619.1 hypothetical protein N481_20600 [Pseudoalteromonas luteoviolacea S4047-1]